MEAGGDAITDRVRALARIHHAMTAYPELVAGEGRYCTVLMNAFDGQVVGKLGADACYGIGVRASERTRALGADGALGISVKIEDGNLDVLYMVVSELLERLQIGTAEQRAAGRLPSAADAQHAGCRDRARHVPVRIAGGLIGLNGADALLPVVRDAAVRSARTRPRARALRSRRESSSAPAPTTRRYARGVPRKSFSTRSFAELRRFARYAM